MWVELETLLAQFQVSGGRGAEKGLGRKGPCRSEHDESALPVLTLFLVVCHKKTTVPKIKLNSILLQLNDKLVKHNSSYT